MILISEKTISTEGKKKPAARRRKGRIADREETLRFYSDVMRAKLLEESGQPPKLAERLRAAEALAKRQEEDEGSAEAVKKLDELLEAVRDAAFS